MRIAAERLSNLTQFGYTAEEACFLYIVATHSGYFTHRQFLAFSGTKPGKHSQKFLEKLLTEEHATYHTYPSGGRVYHVFSRKIYKAIGRDDLRTRRKHQLEYIKTRIVVLDFVLSNLDCEYLETEAEKVPFFESRFNLSRALLPSKTYTSKLSRNASVRYFVDRFPMFVRAASAPTPTLAFTYMDAGAATIQGLGTHLHAYRELFRRMPAFEFIYVAPTEHFVAAAGSEFSRSLLGRPHSPSSDELLRYFRLRETWESGDRVPAADVVFLNAVKRDHDGEEIDSQYRKWIEGAIQDSDVFYRRASEKPQVHGTFLTEKRGSSLAVFHRSTPELGESFADMSSGGVSPRFSPEGLPA
jgi:hypothetical protein